MQMEPWIAPQPTFKEPFELLWRAPNEKAEGDFIVLQN